MNRVLAISKMHLKDKYSWVIVPLGILLLAFMINYVIGLSITDKNIYTGSLSALYIYVMVMGMVILKDTFAFSLGFGIRRADYFWGTMLMITGLSAFFSVMIIVLSMIEFQLGGWGVRLYFFHIPYFSEGSIIPQFLIHLLLLIHLFLSGIATSSIYYRFGKWATILFWVLSFALLSSAVLLLTYYEKWSLFFEWVTRYSALELALITIPFSLLYGVFTYFCLRKATA